MDRNMLLNEIKKLVKEENVIKHMLAVEAVMIGLAKRLNQDEEIWGISGLVHDIDYDKTKKSLKFHGIQGAKILENLGVPQEIIYATKAHNPVNAFERKTLLDKALWVADPAAGLITACALVQGKKLENVTLDFVLKRFAEKRFAAGANRDMITSCKDIGFSLDEFLEIALSKMKEIHKEIDL